jgi:PAS domain-containing protein
MPKHQGSEAVLTLDTAGRFIDANLAALELLGVSLVELRASAPDRFAMRPTIAEEQTALRAQWEAGGSQPLVGTAGLRRADGTTIRVAYAIEAADPGLRARLWHIDAPPDEPTTIFTVGEVLREWRAAERELAELAPGTQDWARTLLEIELLRSRYQELFRAAEPYSEMT